MLSFPVLVQLWVLGLGGHGTAQEKPFSDHEGLLSYLRDFAVVYWGYIKWIKEKENGSYYITLGLYRDNGKERGNYYGVITSSSYV